MKGIIRRYHPMVNLNHRDPVSKRLIPGLDDIFDLEGEITAYLDDLGIDHNVEVEFDRNDPDDDYSCDLYVAWDEDDDRQSFVVRDAQRFTLETLYDLWVRDREAQHAHYLEWLKTETA